MEVGMSTVICQAWQLQPIDILSNPEGVYGERSVSLKHSTCVYISLVSHICGEFSRLLAVELNVLTSCTTMDQLRPLSVTLCTLSIFTIACPLPLPSGYAWQDAGLALLAYGQATVA
jgi:hypothetical protein